MLRPVPVARRRSQRERRETTHRALLEATVACLVERGHAGTTTPEICRRAGVSQGALFKHFASKAELLAAAAEDLFAHLIDEFRVALPDLAGEPDRAEAAVWRLWEVFALPRLRAAFELYNAARTDADLRASLAPVAARHGQNLRQHARDLFPGAAERNPDFDAVVGLAVSALQGAALGRLSEDDRSHEPLLALLVDWVRKAVA